MEGPGRRVRILRNVLALALSLVAIAVFAWVFLPPGEETLCAHKKYVAMPLMADASGAADEIALCLVVEREHHRSSTQLSYAVYARCTVAAERDEEAQACERAYHESWTRRR